jgi:hypothetical protein
MKMAEMALAILGGLGNTVGIRAGTEEPRFSVVERVGAIEIRHYGPRLAAEVEVSGPEEAARSEGFRKVAGYIFGGNTGKASIAMTAPVSQSGGGAQTIAMTAPVAQAPGAGGTWRIQFYMPAKYTRESLPTPKDPSVRIVEVPAQDYAVLRFSGSRTAPAVAAKTQALKAALAGARWRIVGEPVAWFYDPPWTLPFLRRNEVAAPVAPAP